MAIILSWCLICRKLRSWLNRSFLIHRFLRLIRPWWFNRTWNICFIVIYFIHSSRLKFVKVLLQIRITPLRKPLLLSHKRLRHWQLRSNKFVWRHRTEVFLFLDKILACWVIRKEILSFDASLCSWVPWCRPFDHFTRRWVIWWAVLLLHWSEVLQQ